MRLALYGEDIILINFIVNFILLASVFRARRRKVSYWRCSLAASLGALYALAAVGGSGALFEVAFKLASCAAMGIIITPKPIPKDAAINSALILCTSFSCAGATLFFSYLAKGAAAPGTIFAAQHATRAAVFLGALFGSAVASLVYDRAFLRLEGVEFSRAVVVCGARQMKATLLNDTGNLLRTLGGHSITLLSEPLFRELTGIQRCRLDSYEEFEREREGMDAFQKERVGIAMVESMNGSSLQIIFRADALRLEGGFAASPAYISAAKNMSSSTFDGIYNQKYIMERLRRDDCQTV
ncbi:MAG: sigma-E processing peptidase SpoIIGA [Eubacteriaceae bacterium]|jgi:hypothetical protein|nr:sigma-E processing peptidase SpoIIGA [Eubacteriaceae bacterium]